MASYSSLAVNSRRPSESGTGPSAPGPALPTPATPLTATRSPQAGLVSPQWNIWSNASPTGADASLAAGREEVLSTSPGQDLDSGWSQLSNPAVAPSMNAWRGRGLSWDSNSAAPGAQAASPSAGSRMESTFERLRRTSASTEPGNIYSHHSLSPNMRGASVDQPLQLGGKSPVARPLGTADMIGSDSSNAFRMQPKTPYFGSSVGGLSLGSVGGIPAFSSGSSTAGLRDRLAQVAELTRDAEMSQVSSHMSSMNLAGQSGDQMSSSSSVSSPSSASGRASIVPGASQVFTSSPPSGFDSQLDYSMMQQIHGSQSRSSSFSSVWQNQPAYQQPAVDNQSQTSPYGANADIADSSAIWSPVTPTATLATPSNTSTGMRTPPVRSGSQGSNGFAGFFRPASQSQVPSQKQLPTQLTQPKYPRGNNSSQKPGMFRSFEPSTGEFGYDFVPAFGTTPAAVPASTAPSSANVATSQTATFSHSATSAQAGTGSRHSSGPERERRTASHGASGRRGGDTYTSRGPLLEEFRSNKGRKFDLKDIYGHVVEFSGDQHGSRFIQQRLESATAEEKELIFIEISPNSLHLMTDVFGNYVIQKFFELGSPSQRAALADQMEKHVLSLSLQMYGCRVVQKAVEFVAPDQQALLIAELDGHVLECVKDQNGNHVIQKAIEKVSAEHIGFIFSAFHDQVYQLATHPYGCRVIQRMLEYCGPESQQALLEELHKHTDSLVEDQYGNYVVQHVIEKGKPADRHKAIEIVQVSVVSFSRHKYASNVVEKCILFGSKSERAMLIDEILRPRTDGTVSVAVMMKDQFANYVIQKLLDASEGEDHDRLVNAIRPQLQALKKHTYGKHLASIEKLLGGEFGTDQDRESPVVSRRPSGPRR